MDHYKKEIVPKLESTIEESARELETKREALEPCKADLKDKIRKIDQLEFEIAQRKANEQMLEDRLAVQLNKEKLEAREHLSEIDQLKCEITQRKEYNQMEREVRTVMEKKLQKAQENIVREEIKTEDLQHRIHFYGDYIQAIMNVTRMENANLSRALLDSSNEKDALVKKLEIAAQEIQKQNEQVLPTKDDSEQISIPLWICYIIAGCTGLFLILIVIILVIWCVHKTRLQRLKMLLQASRTCSTQRLDF